MDHHNRARAPRTTSRHHNVIVEFLEEHPEMLTRKFKLANSRQKYNENWECLTEKLNSLGDGCKTQNQWQKVNTFFVKIYMYGKKLSFAIHRFCQTGLVE